MLYVAAGSAGVGIYDISLPLTPRLLGAVQPANGAGTVAVGRSEERRAGKECGSGMAACPRSQKDVAGAAPPLAVAPATASAGLSAARPAMAAAAVVSSP